MQTYSSPIGISQHLAIILFKENTNLSSLKSDTLTIPSLDECKGYVKKSIIFVKILPTKIILSCLRMIFLRTTISSLLVLKHESLPFTSKITSFTETFLNCSP